MMFAYLDSLLAGLYLLALRKKDARATFGEKEFKVNELFKHADITSFINERIGDEVDNFNRKSYNDRFEDLSKLLDASFDPNALPWSTFVEAAQRRHLAVHTDLRASRQYLQECAKHGFDVSHVGKGDSLHLTPSYCRKAQDVIEEVGFKACAYYGPILFPDQKNDIIAWLSGHVYNYLLDNRNEIACSLSKFLLNRKNDMVPERRLRLQVNCAQALKRIGKREEFDSLMAEIQWNVLDINFRLAAAALREDVGETLSIIKAKADFSEKEFGTIVFWPLYKELRANPEFKREVEGLFGRTFDGFGTLDKMLDLSSESDSPLFRS